MGKAKNNRLPGNSGIAIGPILFIIAILGILAAAISAGAGFFSTSTSGESTRANAQALVDYGTQLREAVQLVTSRGCSDTEVNFYDPVLGFPINPNAPADKSCNIFSPNGGGMLNTDFRKLPVFDTTKLDDNGNWWGTAGHFTQQYTTRFIGIGTNDIELTFVLPALNLDTCTAINRIVGYNPPTFAPINSFPPFCVNFIGAYSGCMIAAVVMGSAFSNANGQACFSTAVGYLYTGILIAR